jgi:putative ABC transport system permease protein
LSVWETVRIALRALRSNKMRTALTMLGMIIGVGAVIAMVALGQGAAKKMREQWESMGTNLVSVRPGGPSRHSPGGPPGGSQNQVLKASDADAISRKFPETIAGVAKVSRGSGDVKLGNATTSTQLIGASPDYETVAKMAVETGRFLNEEEENQRSRVAVVGRSVVEKLTGDRLADMVGQDILVRRTRFKVVGILKSRGTGSFGQDQDDLIIVPCSTAMRRLFNRDYLSEIAIQCRTEKDTDQVIEQVSSLLRERHKLKPPYPDNDDFNVRSQAQILEASAASSQVMTSLLGGVALVSLLVGGIGIMNIMLVSVTERTREIGIRKAVGATNHNILQQFLVESLVIAVMGGLMGIALGVTAVLVIAHTLGWDAIIQASSVVLSVVVSAGVGLFFGIYPAYRAANLNPIEALRYE